MHRTGKGVDRVCRTQRQWQSILLVSVVALVAAMPGIGAAGPRGKIADAPSARMDADRTSNDDGAVLVLADRLVPWSPAGYGPAIRRPATGRATVLTPASTLAVLAHGYRPVLHPTAP